MPCLYKMLSNACRTFALVNGDRIKKQETCVTTATGIRVAVSHSASSASASVGTHSKQSIPMPIKVWIICLSCWGWFWCVLTITVFPMYRASSSKVASSSQKCGLTRFGSTTATKPERLPLSWNALYWAHNTGNPSHHVLPDAFQAPRWDDYLTPAIR